MTDPDDARRIQILMAAADQALDLVFYDRKEDEDLPRGSIEDAVESGVVGTGEIVAAFRARLFEALGLEDS